jgi:hypothetical protein
MDQTVKRRHNLMPEHSTVQPAQVKFAQLRRGPQQTFRIAVIE